MRITVSLTNNRPDAWIAGFQAEFPDADIDAWQPGAPMADHAVVWAPAQQMLDEQTQLRGLFNIGAGVDALLVLRLPPQARIVRLASDRGEKLAFGVDEDTALVVDDPLGKNPRMQVLGKNGVSIFRLDRARAHDGKTWGISNVKFAYLGDGDRYHLGSNRVLIDGAKARVDGPGHRKLAGPHATVVGGPSYYKATRDGQLQRSMRGATLSFLR